MGKLIVIEGTDGSGKSTQFRLLSEHLEKDNVAFKHIVFPRYDQESSALIRMYLGGAFGDKPSDVNAYAASCFYGVDRFASYKMDWGNYYENGGVVLSDRYTTSNAVHQTSKEPEEKREEFLKWLYDFEYNKLALPQPDLIITNTKADIHEKDMQYLATCRQVGRAAADFYGWTVISCVKDGAMRTIEDIHQEIYSYVKCCLEA